MASANNRAIQFTEVDDVLRAFTMAKLPCWSISQGNQFLFNYCGSNLEDALSMLEEHLKLIENSGAIYTLKVYKKTDDLNEKTPCNGSFNFRLVDYNETSFADVRYPGRRNVNNEILSKLNALEEKLAKLEAEDDDDDDDDDDALGKISSILENPVVMGLIGKLFSGSAKPAALAGISESDANAVLANALNVLKEKDENIAYHLDKLSKIAVNNPMQFRMLLSMLDSM